MNGYTPAVGHEFNILDFSTPNGEFAQLSLPSLNGLVWDTSQLYTTGELSVAIPTSGDFNFDGALDAADYVMWRKINSGDAGAYATWRENFGEPAGGSGSDASANATAPEPAALVMLMFSVAGWYLRQRRVA